MDIVQSITVIGRDSDNENDPNRLFKDTLTFCRDYIVTARC